MTDNHNYKTPAHQSRDWHVPLNENFKALDVDVEIRGKFTNRPSNPPNGTKFVETDESTSEPGATWIYRNNTWTKQPVTAPELSVVNNHARIENTSTGQSIASQTATIVNLDTVASEDATVLDAQTSNSSITAQQAGTYLCIATVKWVSDTGWTNGDIARVGLVVNGVTVYDAVNAKIGTGDQGVQAISALELAAGDTVQSEVWQNSGASKTVNGTGNQVNLIITRLG